LQNKGGWLFAEYHWMAWALSCLQLKRFYVNVELNTDSIGKGFFENILQLPYTKINANLDQLNHYDKRLWALAKIYSYYLHAESDSNEPFIHVDGDIFIWKPFDKKIVGAELIAQNFEVDFPFYQEPLRKVQDEFNNVPICMIDELKGSSKIYSCNTGVIGGHNLELFREYKKLAFNFIDSNIDNLTKVEIKHFNICFEQFLYFILAKSKGININYVIENEFDPTYPNYADFHEVPHKTWYIHAMADYKQKKEVCYHLARRLRMDYPEYYYRIIDLGLNQGLELDWKCYPLNKLDETWRSFYEKDKNAYQTVELLFGKQRKQILTTQLQFSKDCQIEEIETPEYGQVLHYPDITKVAYSSKTLDSLNIILLDAFQEQIIITDAIEAIKPYFDSEEINQDTKLFEDLIISRIKDFMFMGVIVLA
jgi:hypothetical protein